ncbi:MAG: hypothetical protein KF819_19565 [Labilithrix sp.]|nr:hypothetical protein [Labilithrix sp.]
MRRSPPQRWPLVLESAPAPPSKRRHRIAASSFGVAALCAAAFPDAPIPLGVRIVLGVLGLAGIAWAALLRRPPAQASGTYLEADTSGLTRITEEAKKPIVAWESPFGVSLLASYGRPTALLAFTTPTQTRYVPARIDDRSEADDELLARIAVLADLDLVDGVAHDAALTAAATAALVRHVEVRDKDALGRVFLSDGKGTPIALDRATLAIGERSFDLTSQLEWRPLMFHESTGQAAALYQATWIKQAGAEVVLVAPMPASIVPRESSAHREASGKLGRALTRDLRLLQAPAEAPPAREVRVAIDRPFMMAVRRVLDDAPLAARVPLDPPARAHTERRAH